MQDYYKWYCDKYGKNDTGHYSVLGVSLHYTKFIKNILHSDVGIVLLNINDCSASIVSHELFHAILHAYKHTKYKKQYPIVIKNMTEEEKILHNHSFAVNQFYNWYWKVESKFKVI